MYQNYLWVCTACVQFPIQPFISFITSDKLIPLSFNIHLEFDHSPFTSMLVTTISSFQISLPTPQIHSLHDCQESSYSYLVKPSHYSDQNHAKTPHLIQSKSSSPHNGLRRPPCCSVWLCWHPLSFPSVTEAASATQIHCSWTTKSALLHWGLCSYCFHHLWNPPLL